MKKISFLYYLFCVSTSLCFVGLSHSYKTTRDHDTIYEAIRDLTKARLNNTKSEKEIILMEEKLALFQNQVSQNSSSGNFLMLLSGICFLILSLIDEGFYKTLRPKVKLIILTIIISTVLTILVNKFLIWNYSINY